MKYYSLDVDEVLNSLNSYESGLSLNEADIRLKKYGKNKIIEAKKQSKFLKFLNEFKN